MSIRKWIIVSIMILLVAPAYSGSVAAGTDTAPTAASIDLNGIALSTTPSGACSAPGVDLQGWTVTDDTNKQYVFGNSTISAGENITLYTGNGTNNQTKLYWDYGSGTTAAKPCTVFLRNGTTIDQESYDSDSENFTNLDSLQNIEITRVNANPTGDDVNNLTDEYIELENEGSDEVNLSDWTISDDANQRYLFPDSTDSLLSPNETITLHTGSGTTNETDFYWNASTPIWDNEDQGGDTIYLRNGTLVDKETYSDEETTFELGDSKSVVEINSIHADAEGSEYDNLDDEYVTFTHRTDEDVSLGNRTPVSPEAGDNVTVNATVSDAQEVCLSYTVNGGNETSVTMDSLGNDRYQGVIPGQAPEDNVTYHVYAVDSSGRVSVSETRNFSFKPLDLDIMSGDPVRESGTTTNYSVFGEIVSYRPAVNNFVISVDGTDRNVDFNVTDLEETAAVSNMTVFASGVVSLSDGKKRVEVRVTNSSGQTVENDTIRLDGDGLKPSVEENVTQTDPFDPDSDSAVTSTDESGDGTVDGREDFDDDGLVTKNEIRFDTDPFDEDSDSDQLQDGFEVSNGFDPLSNDTNNDSTLDPDWDPDSDSLDNLQEQNLGTNPRLPDTDADNLNDSVEVNVHGTDPVDEDTDNDTILDGNEIRLGTDPLSEDSDGDGTPDGSETYTSTKENEQLGVGVDITGEGYVAKNVSIGRTGNVEFPSGKTTDSYVSQVVEIESRDEFDSANITFSYNESNYQNESNITIVRYNETTGKYDAVETEIDEQANTAKANVSHFSRYGIMDLDPVADLIRNLAGGSTTGAIDLTGWKLKDKCCHDGEPFEISLSDYGSVAPGEVVRIETTEEYDSAIWNNDKGDTIRLIDDSGNIVDSESYNGSEATEGTVLDDFSTTKGEMSISSARPNAEGNDNVNPSREYVEITYTANSTTCGFSESVRDLDQIFVTGYRFLGEVGDGPELTATESDGCDTDGDGLEDKDELGERVALSDTIAGQIATIYTDISEMEAENTEIAFEWKSDPTDPNTDGVGFDDGEEVEPTVGKREPSNPKKVELFYAALNPLVVVDDDNNRPITLDELKSEPYNANVVGPGLLNRFVMIGRSAPDPRPDSEALVPMDMVLQSTSSDPPSVEYDTGVSTTNRDENTALTISPRYEAGETLFLGGLEYEKRYNLRVDADLENTKFYSQTEDSKSYGRYTISSENALSGLDGRIDDADFVVNQGTSIALGRASALGKGDAPFIRRPGTKSLPRRFARLYFWSEVDDDNRYEELPLDAAVNGISAFSDRVNAVSPSEIPGSGTDAGYSGPFVYRLR